MNQKDQTMRSFPTLYKKTANSKIQSWSINVVPTNPPVIRITHGLIGGKKQTADEKILTGCNIGKSNATSAIEQAYLKSEQQWRYQKDRNHYGETVGESISKVDAAPMLAQVYADQISNVDWSSAFVQPKFDGNRCLAKKEGSEVTLWTRGGKLVTSTPHLNLELNKILQDGDVFDGELYIHGLPLNRLRSIVSKKQDGSKQIQLRIYDKVMEEPFAIRIKELEQRFAGFKCNSVYPVETLPVLNDLEVIVYQVQCLERGYEGAILRHSDAPYESGKRSRSLLKVKTFRDSEFPIVSVEEGKGKFEGCAIFVLTTKDGNRFRATAPGTLEEKAAAWKNRRQLVGRSITVKFQMMTSTDHPVPFLPVCTHYGEVSC